MGDIVDLSIPEALDRRNRRTLSEIAKAVNETVREVREFQNDRRLKMALDLADAKALCAEHKIPFKQWVADNIELVGYPEATKLAKIGAADDPAKALGDLRATVKRKTQEGRQNRVVHVNNSEPPSPPERGSEAICERVKDAIVTLAGLPPASEVASYFQDSDQAMIVDEKLLRSLDWLSEFAEAWSNPCRSNSRSCSSWQECSRCTRTSGAETVGIVSMSRRKIAKNSRNSRLMTRMFNSSRVQAARHATFSMTWLCDT